MEKIGIGLITCNAWDRFRQSAPLIPDVEEFVVVDDGKGYEDYPSEAHIIKHKTNSGVEVSKNDALKYLMGKNCDHIFLVEDDIIIKDPFVFDSYIEASQKSGIMHFNYALQNPENRQPKFVHVEVAPKRFKVKRSKVPNPRKVVEYDGTEIAFYKIPSASLSYFGREAVEKVGFFDENMPFGHIDYTYRIIKAGLHPPFWWFADLAHSNRYIDTIEDSYLYTQANYSAENLRKRDEKYKKKHGFTFQETQSASEKDLEKWLIAHEKEYNKAWEDKYKDLLGK